MSEKHTYPDGSARVGEPPFPKLSPVEEAAGKKEPEPKSEAASVPAAAVSKRVAAGKKAD